MHALQDEVETIHLYVVREQPKKPYTALPLLGAALCLLGIVMLTLYSGSHPAYIRTRLTVPAIALPPQTFTARVPVIPTGVKVLPATAAHGRLTITNGSVVAQTLPAGLILLSNSGVEVATDTAVFVPPGSADDYGRTTVAAHAVVPGINVPTLAVNQTLGTSLYVRNLQPFSGGHPARTIPFVTAQDKQAAATTVQALLALQIHGLHYPCREFYSLEAEWLTATWHCQFVTYTVPSYMHVTAAKLAGKNFLVDVVFIPRPVQLWVR